MPSGFITKYLKIQPPQGWAPIIAERTRFVGECSPATQEIHYPIVDLFDVSGHLNPAGLGHAKLFSEMASVGQSSVAFNRVREYEDADVSGVSPYGGAEYAVVQTPEGAAVCAKIVDGYEAAGGIVCPSGLSAITTAFRALKPHAVIKPKHVYGPTTRFLNDAQIPQIEYDPRAKAEDMKDIFYRARNEFHASKLILYIEAPTSGYFEVPDLAGIAGMAKDNGILSMMDNTYGTFVRCNPLKHGVNIVIDAATKYLGGYGDTTSGFVGVDDPKYLEDLKWEQRVSGNGYVAPPTCARLFNRMDSALQRMDQQFAAAEMLTAWFAQQSFVQNIYCPALPSSPDHAAFAQYFGKGNGLFTVKFHQNIPEAEVVNFLDGLNLFRAAASWGGHVSLISPVDLHQGVIRFHAGLEDPVDLVRDLSQSRHHIHSCPHI